MKRIDVIKRLAFFPNQFSEIKLPEGSKILNSMPIGDMVYVFYLDSIVDEAEKVECAHDWEVKGTLGNMMCIKCGRIRTSAPDPDPIIEVYNKYMSKNVCWYDAKTNDKRFDNLLNEAKDFWRAIVKYAEGKGKK